MVESMHAWNQEVHAKPLHLPLNFAMLLKLLYKNEVYIFLKIYITYKNHVFLLQ